MLRNNPFYDAKDSTCNLKRFFSQSNYLPGSNAPVLNTFQFSGQLNLGLRTTVVCSVLQGDPPFHFTYFKDDQPLRLSDTISFKTNDEYTSFLTIKSLSADSNGKYTCKVSNAAGTDEKSDTLNIKGNAYTFTNHWQSLWMYEEKYLSTGWTCFISLIRWRIDKFILNGVLLFFSQCWIMS